MSCVSSNDVATVTSSAPADQNSHKSVRYSTYDINSPQISLLRKHELCVERRRGQTLFGFCRQKFSKVSSLINLRYQVTQDLTVEENKLRVEG